MISTINQRNFNNIDIFLKIKSLEVLCDILVLDGFGLNKGQTKKEITFKIKRFNISKDIIKNLIIRHRIFNYFPDRSSLYYFFPDIKSDIKNTDVKIFFMLILLSGCTRRDKSIFLKTKLFGNWFLFLKKLLTLLDEKT